jgi:signal transduction histidine kinase
MTTRGVEAATRPGMLTCIVAAIDEDEAFETLIRVQMRFWARIAGVVLIVASALQSLWHDESFRPAIVAIDFAWAVGVVRGASRPWWLAFAAALAVVGVSLYGWAMGGSLILVVAALSMRLPAIASASAMCVLWCATALGLFLFGGDQPPEYEMRLFECVFATTNTYFLGALMRKSLHMRGRAEQLAAKLRAANDMLRSDIHTAEALAAAQERARIARELHDSLGHSLATAHVHTQLARRLVGDGADPAVVSAIDQVGLSTRQAMHELRDAVALLRPRQDDAPLSERIATLLRGLPSDILRHELVVEGKPRALSAAQEFALYRALQEAITNVAKHARARSVHVRLAYAVKGVTLEIVDDGIGCADIRRGFGLRGMAERLDAVGGRLSISSTPGGVFELRLAVESA